MVDKAKELIEEYETAKLRIDLVDRESAIVVHLSGMLTSMNAEKLVAQVIPLLQREGLKKVVLDMSDVTNINSTGLGALVSVFTSAKNAQVESILVGLQTKVRDVLQLTKLYTVWPIFGTVDEALSA